MSLLPKREPLDEDFRVVGMTGNARNFPRSEEQIRMFAAWLGYDADKLPDAMKYFANAHQKAAWERSAEAIKVFHNWNPPTVVVAVVWIGSEYDPKAGLLAIRRKLPDGFGKVALPGGFQETGEDWRSAVVRETFEETGVRLNPEAFTSTYTVTVEGGRRNLLFCHYDSTRAIPKIPDDFGKENDEAIPFVWIPHHDAEMLCKLEYQTDWAFDEHLKVAHQTYFNMVR